MYVCIYYACIHYDDLLLDNILLKCANETNASEHHPSLLRQSSLESVRCTT